MFKNTLKTAAMTALLGLGMAGAGGTAASAYTIRTNCDGSDCVRMRCNDLGYDCVRVADIDRYDYDRPYVYTTQTYTYYPYAYDYRDGYYRDYDDHARYHYDYDNDYNEYAYPD